MAGQFFLSKRNSKIRFKIWLIFCLLKNIVISSVIKKMMTINLFSKIFRSLIILFFILFTFSSFSINPHILGQDNICTSEKNDINEKCENDCLCDRDKFVHAEDYGTFTLNKARINNYKIFLSRQKFIEEKMNSPPII